ncbi:hypothetical protein AMTR_s00030p00194140 [Amborella trichopoda]|uniref:Uncharacterized protein n=1 Tax=Amborella trichopoda TaxID=13333 RepID=U5D3X7_AMBTC|nr:hypothetical protein AMTR_s00030p00194140 [Amborella trichopoda]
MSRSDNRLDSPAWPGKRDPNKLDRGPQNAVRWLGQTQAQLLRLRPISLIGLSWAWATTGLAWITRPSPCRVKGLSCLRPLDQPELAIGTRVELGLGLAHPVASLRNEYDFKN